MKKTRQQDERRKYVRVSIFQDLILGNKSVQRANDISEDGMFIATRDTFMKGSTMNLCFSLFNDDRPIELEAVVIHAKEGEGMGVKFLTIKPEDQERIRSFIRKFQS